MGIENFLITLFRINFNKMEFLRIYTHVRCHFKWIVVKVGAKNNLTLLSSATKQDVSPVICRTKQVVKGCLTRPMACGQSSTAGYMVYIFTSKHTSYIDGTTTLPR